MLYYFRQSTEYKNMRIHLTWMVITFSFKGPGEVTKDCAFLIKNSPLLFDLPLPTNIKEN